MNAFRVVVPSSTSNLGPGFDCLGLALERYVRVDVKLVAAGSAHVLPLLRGTLAEHPLEGEERITRAMRALAKAAGRDLPEVEISATSTIPVARGLGSSGSATVAGLVAADRLLATRWTRDQLFDLGCALEGHPDNVGPALVGGCTVAMPDAAGSIAWFRARVHPALRVAVACPRTRVETAHARGVLPEMVNFTVARDQARRLAQLLHGLESCSRRHLALGMRDELHTPYRAPLIPNCKQVMDAAEKAGAFASAISGSGSAIIAIGQWNESPMEEIAAAMARAFNDAREECETFVSSVPAEGYKIEDL